MDKVKKWSYECTAKEISQILRNKKYNVVVVDNLEEAREKVLELIPKGSSIAMGGSATLGEMDLLSTFRSEDYKFYDRYQDLPWPERVEIMRQSLLADFLVTGTNAITKKGELVNVDSSGNRAAGMIFGPKKVIVVAGVNKVVEDLDEAIKRIRKIAPLNAKRINHEAPCVETGKCEDCMVPGRICNYMSVVNQGGKFDDRFTIIIVADEVGY